jgi:hypothetical protein
VRSSGRGELDDLFGGGHVDQDELTKGVGTGDRYRRPGPDRRGAAPTRPPRRQPRHPRPRPTPVGRCGPHHRRRCQAAGWQRPRLRPWASTLLEAPGRSPIEVTATPSRHRPPLSRPSLATSPALPCDGTARSTGLVDYRRHGAVPRRPPNRRLPVGRPAPRCCALEAYASRSVTKHLVAIRSSPRRARTWSLAVWPLSNAPKFVLLGRLRGLPLWAPGCSRIADTQVEGMGHTTCPSPTGPASERLTSRLTVAHDLCKAGSHSGGPVLLALRKSGFDGR